MIPLRTLIIGTTALLLSSAALAVAPANLQEQRQRFLDARTALDKGDSVRFEKLSKELRDYPLYPYLLSWQMERQHFVDDKQARGFLARFGDTLFSLPVREQWLRQLAEAERWDEYLTEYRPSNRGELRCNYHYAQLRSGNESAAWAGARALWLSANRQENSCNRLFEAWEKSGGLTAELRHQRLDLILRSGNMSFARQIAATMPDSERRRVDLWQQVHNRPALINSDNLQKDTDENRDIIVYGLQRLARNDAQEAAEQWHKMENRYAFTPQQRNSALNTLVYRLALAGDSSALDWYGKIPTNDVQSTTRQWAIRVALRHQRWLDALNTLRLMSDEERAEEEWQYWTARSLEALGGKAPAQHLYHGIADNSSFYGFLAADRLDTGYNLSHRPVEVADAYLEMLQQRPEMVRAYEFLQLNLTKEARREWESAIAAMDSSDRIAAGKLANRWGWHDRAALTLAKADYYDDLEIRFPLAYTDAVMKEAEHNTLDPAWVFAVARQESVMMPDARSPVGALGLMQLMPATGRNIARKLKSALSDLQQLLRPELNIRFGSYYLRELSDQFDGHKALATAAYNAGPHRVKQWAPEQEQLDADIWIDTIPFGETRTYVRRVLTYSVFYDQRLEKPVIRLRDRLPVVQKEDTKG